jgi:hypothetical protein
MDSHLIQDTTLNLLSVYVKTLQMKNNNGTYQKVLKAFSSEHDVRLPPHDTMS